ncbi:GNAT family N-acetyltransferase [Paenibacillus eucommiae]|uniref:RimJ/RimL family protein N-acetyltransferase n=1 Tax=Paenibacillus eucommiae TaxID=1355755 RepID=A0ABS4J3G1_9BACL|nr:GNAT family protein [Paenibacillus eucommiae]MBP1994386.1 RimJ/RimL family protein N-acetyltransferase [Paenibacillus eucommiae]
MIKGEIQLEGKRVRLIPMSLEHLDGLFEASNQSEIWKYSPSEVSKPEHLEMNKKIELRDQGLGYPFVVFDKDVNEIVGSTSYMNISERDRKLEIGGTWLHPKVWRTSVNTECKYLLLKYGFEELDLVRVQFRTDARNERSNRAIQRIGAQLEGTLRQEMIMHDGHFRDSNVYSILDKEWDGIRDKLLGYLSNG